MTAKANQSLACVVRADGHELRRVAQPRVDEPLAEHRAREAAELVAVDVDQMDAAPVDEHVQVVAVADHDPDRVERGDRVVEREQRRDQLGAVDRMLATPARLAVRVERRAR